MAAVVVLRGLEVAAGGLDLVESVVVLGALAEAATPATG